MTDRELQAITQDLEDITAERDRLRLEKSQLKRQVDKFSGENKDLRKLNSAYLQMIEDKPIRTGTLKEIIKQQARQIEQLEHALKVERLQSQYTKPEPQPETKPEPVQQVKTRRGRRALSADMKTEIRELYANGQTVREIRDKLGCSLGAISKVLNEQK